MSEKYTFRALGSATTSTGSFRIGFSHNSVKGLEGCLSTVRRGTHDPENVLTFAGRLYDSAKAEALERVRTNSVGGNETVIDIVFEYGSDIPKTVSGIRNVMEGLYFNAVRNGEGSLENLEQQHKLATTYLTEKGETKVLDQITRDLQAARNVQEVKRLHANVLNSIIGKSPELIQRYIAKRLEDESTTERERNDYTRILEYAQSIERVRRETGPIPEVAPPFDSFEGPSKKDIDRDEKGATVASAEDDPFHPKNPNNNYGSRIEKLDPLAVETEDITRMQDESGNVYGGIVKKPTPPPKARPIPEQERVTDTGEIDRILTREDLNKTAPYDPIDDNASVQIGDVGMHLLANGIANGIVAEDEPAPSPEKYPVDLESVIKPDVKPAYGHEKKFPKLVTDIVAPSREKPVRQKWGSRLRAGLGKVAKAAVDRGYSLAAKVRDTYSQRKERKAVKGTTSKLRPGWGTVGLVGVLAAGVTVATLYKSNNTSSATAGIKADAAAHAHVTDSSLEKKLADAGVAVTYDATPKDKGEVVVVPVTVTPKPLPPPLPVELDDSDVEIVGDADKVITYTIKVGDNLSKISTKLGTNWRTLYDQNKEIIGTNPSLIRVGKTITYTPTKVASKKDARVIRITPPENTDITPLTTPIPASVLVPGTQTTVYESSRGDTIATAAEAVFGNRTFSAGRLAARILRHEGEDVTNGKLMIGEKINGTMLNGKVDSVRYTITDTGGKAEWELLKDLSLQYNLSTTDVIRIVQERNGLFNFHNGNIGQEIDMPVAELRAEEARQKAQRQARALGR